MSDNTVIVVGLKGKEFKNHVIDEDDEVAPPKGIHLSYAGFGYENGDVYYYDLKSTDTYCPEIKRFARDNEGGSIFGIYVVGTWNGAIDLESIQDYIDEAKRIFKERTGQEGKVYAIGEQV